jgi:hypothetical protein
MPNNAPRSQTGRRLRRGARLPQVLAKSRSGGPSWRPLREALSRFRPVAASRIEKLVCSSAPAISPQESRRIAYRRGRHLGGFARIQCKGSAYCRNLFAHPAVRRMMRRSRVPDHCDRNRAKRKRTGDDIEAPPRQAIFCRASERGRDVVRALDEEQCRDQLGHTHADASFYPFSLEQVIQKTPRFSRRANQNMTCGSEARKR